MGSVTKTTTTETSGQLEITKEGNIATFTENLVYETVKLDDCEYDPDSETFYYLCPCGDIFELTLDSLIQGDVVAECPSCSLRIRVELEPGDLDPYIRERGNASVDNS